MTAFRLSRRSHQLQEQAGCRGRGGRYATVQVNPTVRGRCRDGRLRR